MEHQIYNIGLLAQIDELLDELNEEFGDLPEQANSMKGKVDSTKATVEETKLIINDINDFIRQARTTLVDLKEREDKLKQQQFNVQNNKEFDALTNEIAFIKREHSKLSEQMRKEALKLENLNVIQDSQVKEHDKISKEYKDKTKEIATISKEQTAEIEKLKRKRERVIETIEPKHMVRYDRIRTMFNDAAVRIHRTSCSGCYNSLPAQQMVDVRNNLDLVYYCENCGRVLLPEDYDADEDAILMV